MRAHRTGMGALLALLALSACKANFSDFRKNRGSVASVADHITIFTSDPAAECDGAAVTTDQGGAITFTRALAAVCLLSDGGGSFTTVASGAPRRNNRGLQIEGSRINVVPRGNDPANAAWTKVNVTVSDDFSESPDSTFPADQLTTTSAGGYIQSTAFVPGNTTLTASAFFIAGVTTEVAIVVRDTTAGADRTTCTVLVSTFDEAYNGHTLVTCASTGLTGANNHVLRIYPAGTSGSGSAVVSWIQAEGPISTLASSYIDTAGTSVTRPNEVATFANGTDISTQGCISARVTFSATGLGATGGSIITNGTEKMLGYSSPTAMVINDGTNTVTATVPSVLGRTITMKSSWSGSSMTIVADGVTATGTFDGSFSSTATMRIGGLSGSQFAYATIENIRIGASPTGCTQ